MDYESLSDLEINEAVQHLRQGEQLWFPILDYCNDPTYSWPIITSSHINIEFRKGPGNNYMDNLARHGDIYETSESPLRAAMVVFLRLQEQ